MAAHAQMVGSSGVCSLFTETTSIVWLCGDSHGDRIYTSELIKSLVFGFVVRIHFGFDSEIVYLSEL